MTATADAIALATDLETFTSRAHAAGFDEVVVREWRPGQVVGIHSHPFALKARVVRGSFELTVGDLTTRLTEGESFELERDVPHTERYGADGATFWVARRNA